MILRYTGHYPGETTGIGVTMPGDIVEAPLDLAQKLLGQGNWERVVPKAKKITRKRKITEKEGKDDDNTGDDIK